MPLFAIMCRDKPGALEIRKDTRQAHLDYIKETGLVIMAGPLIENGDMAGSLIILDAADLDTARDWAAKDPYALGGLFARSSVTEWNKVIG